MQGILHTNIIIIIIYISFCWTRSSWNFAYAPRILFYIHVQRLTYIHSSIRLIWLENGLCQIYFNHLPRKEHTAIASRPFINCYWWTWLLPMIYESLFYLVIVRVATCFHSLYSHLLCIYSYIIMHICTIYVWHQLRVQIAYSPPILPYHSAWTHVTKT